MADIFLSYNEKDRALVRRLVQALEAAGWSVWWDRRVPAGLTWRKLLEQELQDMRCMLVLWSSHSVQSEWVCEEATEGRLLGRLIPVFIERVRPPAGFREVQAADLVGWDGTPGFAGLQQLLQDITHKLGPPTNAAMTAPALPPQPATQPAPHLATARSAPWPLWGGALLLLAAVGGYFGLRSATQDVAVVGRPPPAAAAAAAVAPTPTAPAPALAVPAPVSPASIAPTPTSPPATPAGPRRTQASARCAALLERQALGENLPGQSPPSIEKECRK